MDVVGTVVVKAVAKAGLAAGITKVTMKSAHQMSDLATANPPMPPAPVILIEANATHKNAWNKN